MCDVTRALTSFSVECCVKAGHSLEAIQETLYIWLEKERVLSKMTPWLCTDLETGMVALAMKSERILVFESVDLVPMRSSSVLLLLNSRQLFVIYICVSW